MGEPLKEGETYRWEELRVKKYRSAHRIQGEWFHVFGPDSVYPTEVAGEKRPAGRYVAVREGEGYRVVGVAPEGELDIRELAGSYLE